MNAKKLGIWMDHEHAHLTEFTTDPMKTITIKSQSSYRVKEESLIKGENHMHVKDQHQLSSYFKKLHEAIRPYTEVVLFGPTSAKTELFNILQEDPLLEKVIIKVEPTDKMTEHQMQAFVRKHFARH